MNIEISEETSRLLQSMLAGGQYSSADELIAAMARQNKPAKAERLADEMPEHVEADQLARQQGVGPITNPEVLEADFWPEGESVETFLSEIRGRRGQDAPRVR